MKKIKASQINTTDDSTSIKLLLAKVGPLIKAAREAQNISSKELAKSLRIGEEQLLALEDCQEASLPEPVFIKAMIRRVSEKLKLNPESSQESSILEKTITPISQPKRVVNAYSTSAVYLSLIAIFSLCLGILWPKLITDYIEKPKENNEKAIYILDIVPQINLGYKNQAN